MYEESAPLMQLISSCQSFAASTLASVFKPNPENGILERLGLKIS